MTRLSFQFEIVAADDPKTNIILITSITDEEKQKFEVPRHLGIRKYHTQLETLPEYKKVTATLKRRGQTRSVWFNLNKEILRNYVDDNGNMAIGDYLLEEIQQEEHKRSNSFRLLSSASGNRMDSRLGKSGTYKCGRPKQHSWWGCEPTRKLYVKTLELPTRSHDNAG
ncbi:hypothetical protein M0802_014794 [Mischocyttarus mexicanus]|nr:hypothetical protein M0802_014794 [Mischocyttarus mexicanus]